MKTLIQAFSYLFHGLLTAFLIAAAGLVMSGGPLSLDIPILPWTGTTLARGIFGAAVFGLLSVMLALGGKLRGLFFVWSVAVAAVVLKGYVFSGYRIAPGQGAAILGLTLFSLVALAGAWFGLSDEPERRYRY